LEVRLVEPSVGFRASYLEALREFHAEGRRLNMRVDGIAADFEGFVADLKNRAIPGLQPPELAPETWLWLVDGSEYIGGASIRHELNDDLLLVGGHIGYEIRPTKRRQGYGTRILAMALERAREMDIREVLVTCDTDNVGSRRIIEANGGRLENEVQVPNSQVRKLRFWIENGGEVGDSFS
jgi:predicted acetyltransferase